MARNLYYEIDEQGTGYYIKDENDGLFKVYQYPPFIPYLADTIEESAQKHIDAILKAEAEAEKERISIEDLQKQIAELKAINEEQDMLLIEMSTIMV